MKRFSIAATAVLSSVLMMLPGMVEAQATASATATQQLALSAFGGGSGTYTNILGGRNLGITAGADLAFMSFRRYRPVIEARGTYPIHGGQIDAQKNFLAGLKVERVFGRLHPYGDFMVGRGQIDFQNKGLQIGNLIYLSSTSTIFSPGVGVDYDVTPNWAAKADFQYQFWDVPFGTVNGTPSTTVTGTIHPKVLTLGAVYRFDFNHHYRRHR